MWSRGASPGEHHHPQQHHGGMRSRSESPAERVVVEPVDQGVLSNRSQTPDRGPHSPAPSHHHHQVVVHPSAAPPQSLTPQHSSPPPHSPRPIIKQEDSFSRLRVTHFPSGQLHSLPQLHGVLPPGVAHGGYTVAHHGPQGQLLGTEDVADFLSHLDRPQVVNVPVTSLPGTANSRPSGQTTFATLTPLTPAPQMTMPSSAPEDSPHGAGGSGSPVPSNGYAPHASTPGSMPTYATLETHDSHAAAYMSSGGSLHGYLPPSSVPRTYSSSPPPHHSQPAGIPSQPGVWPETYPGGAASAQVQRYSPYPSPTGMSPSPGYTMTPKGAPGGVSQYSPYSSSELSQWNPITSSLLTNPHQDPNRRPPTAEGKIFILNIRPAVDKGWIIFMKSILIQWASKLVEISHTRHSIWHIGN